MTQPSGLPAPINAPWVSNWDQYPVQFFTPQQLNAIAVALTSPTLQWWRIIFLFATYTTSSNAGTRGIALTVSKGTSPSAILFMEQPAGSPADSTSYATWAPGITTYSSTALSGGTSSAVCVPDVIYPPNTKLALNLTNNLAGDGLAVANVTYAIEIYAENAGGELVPAAGLSASPVVV